jgi:hypothetical protein
MLNFQGWKVNYQEHLQAMYAIVVNNLGCQPDWDEFCRFVYRNSYCP